MHFYRALFLAGIAAVLLATAWALPAREPADPTAAAMIESPSIRFDRWTSGNGLPQGSIYSIVQARDGYLWLATLDGLVRFDGSRFTVFNVSNTPGLPENRITALIEDRSGRLWVGGEGGSMATVSNGMASVYRAASNKDSVIAFREGDDGTIWALTQRELLLVRPGATECEPDTRLDLKPMFGVPAGGMTYGCFVGVAGNGILTFAGGEPRLMPFPDGFTWPDSVRGVGQDQAHTVWLWSSDGKLVSFAGDRWTETQAPVTLPPPVDTEPASPRIDPRPTLRDSAGNLWAAIYEYGVVRVWPDGRHTVYRPADGIDTSYRFQAIYEDREKNIWVGSQGGLFRFRGDLIDTFSERDGLGDNNTNAVTETRDGTMWITGGPYLNAYKDGQVTRRTSGDGFATITGRVWALYEDKDGSMWVGASDVRSPVCRVVDGRVEPFFLGVPQRTGQIHAITRDRAGSMWFGAQHGLIRYQPSGDFTLFTRADGLPSDDVVALLESRDETLWVGTYNGLARVVDGRVETVPGADNLRVRVLYEDEDGAIWIGTYDAGLLRYKNGQLRVITMTEGLFNNGVFAILEDGHGNVWMSCNVGVYRARKQDLDAVADGVAPRLISVAYDRDDGMINSECNGGCQPAAWRARDGRLWFASQGGVVIVDPNSSPVNEVPPPVLLEQVAIDNNVSGPPLDVLRVEPGKESFEIRYTGVSFIKPEMMRFRYRLEGLESEWVDADTRRVAYYPHVPPGEYTFQVVAANCDGVLSAHPAVLRVVVEAPWYRTWWAYFGYVAGALGFLYAGVRFRLTALRRRSRELEAIVARRTTELAAKADELSQAVGRLRLSEQQALEAKEQAIEASRAKSIFLSNMSHELRTPLNAVLGFAQVMVRDQSLREDQRESLNIIQRSGEHLLGLINDVLSIAKIEAGKLTLHTQPFDLHRALGAVEEMMRVRAEAKDLLFTIDVDPELPRVVVGDEGKLRQVLINLLGNAVKFTARGQVALTVRVAGDGRVVFEVSDTGAGIAKEDFSKLFQAFEQTESSHGMLEGTGLGLMISRNFVHLMDGDLFVHSEVGYGTTFSFEIALPASEMEAAGHEQRQVLGLEPGQPEYLILVVDDVMENRKVLRRLLESTGFPVAEANDGAEAVEQWRTRRPHLIFMDIRMPVMDGYEATRRIRAEEDAERDANAPVNEEGRGCRIVALSASAFEHDRAAILAERFDDFIAKPFRDAEIFSRLAEHLGVRYVFETQAPAASEDDTPLSSPALAALPEALLFELRDTLLNGDVQGAAEVAERIKDHDAGLGQILATRVRRYRFDEILDAMDQMRAG